MAYTIPESIRSSATAGERLLFRTIASRNNIFGLRLADKLTIQPIWRSFWSSGVTRLYKSVGNDTLSD